MGNFTRILCATMVVASISGGETAAASTLPKTARYTFFLRGERVGQSEVRITESADVLRMETKFRVANGQSVTELSTRTEADPRTYALRTFSYRGTKGGTPVAMSATLDGDSVFGWTQRGDTKTAQRREVTPRPMVIWEDWAMDLEILLALQQAREFKNPSTRGLLLAGSYSSSNVTLGFTGEVAVESGTRSGTGRKLMVAIQGGDPFESRIDLEKGVPMYIRFPGVGAEIFWDEFFGENPVPQYTTPRATPTGQ